MKKTWTRLLAVLLAACLLGPVTARAAEPSEPPEKTGIPEGALSFLQDLGERLRTGGGELLDGLSSMVDDLHPEEFAARLKDAFGDTSALTDEELADKIRAAAEKGHVTLSDEQVDRLVRLIRQLEGLDGEAVEEKLEELRDKARDLEEKSDALEDLEEKTETFLDKAKGFFSWAWDALEDLFH